MGETQNYKEHKKKDQHFEFSISDFFHILQKMNATEFVTLLNREGEYHTPQDIELSTADRMFGNFDLWFYIKLANLIRKCRDHLSKDFTPENWKIYSYQAFRLVEECRGKIHVSGIRNLKKEGPPFVYISNHMSLVETFLLPILMLDVSNIAIILKQDLMSYPVFGGLLRALNPICVSRKNPKEDLQTVMTEGKRVLQEEKRSVLVFPQSTRTTDFDPRDFNSLGVKLAERSDVPCVPVALKTDFLKPGKIVRDIGRIDRSQSVHFKFGEPKKVTKANSRQVHDEIAEFIASSLKEWKR